jgi:hypothetical protein
MFRLLPFLVYMLAEAACPDSVGSPVARAEEIDAFIQESTANTVFSGLYLSRSRDT